VLAPEGGDSGFSQCSRQILETLAPFVVVTIILAQFLDCPGHLGQVLLDHQLGVQTFGWPLPFEDDGFVAITSIVPILADAS